MFDIYLGMGEAAAKLRHLEGENLRRLAEDYCVFNNENDRESIVERNREETIDKLRQLGEMDLMQYAMENAVFYAGKGDRVSSTWFVNALEIFLELPRDSLLVTSFHDELGAWKIEWIPISEVGSTWVMKDEFVVTRIREGDPLPPFQDSNLYNWITRQVMVGVLSSFVPGRIFPLRKIAYVSSFDTSLPENDVLLEEIQADYDLVRAVLSRTDGYSMLTCCMARWLDPPLTSEHIFGVFNYYLHNTPHGRDLSDESGKI